MSNEDIYRSLMSVSSLIKLTTDEALSHICQLTDLSNNMGKIEGVERSIKLSEELQMRELGISQRAVSHFYSANAWAGYGRLSNTDKSKSWEWEQPEIEKEIFHLRSALQLGQGSLPNDYLCPIMTNLGNLLNGVGRVVEAVEYWDKALNLAPTFAMALGNRGIGLYFYARNQYDHRHAAVLLRYAYDDIQNALLFKGAYDQARESFKNYGAIIESVVSKKYLEQNHDMDGFSLGESMQEVDYRKWCLNNKLFLNPLNDLGSYSIAAHDVLSTPSIVAAIGEGPYYQGYFNQIKQEFVSARYLYYEGINSEQPHFSDKEVLLLNTLDYPSYSLALEKVRAAFRLAYSLLDKIAYFLNHYLSLSIPEKKVSFRTFWYQSQNRGKGLKPDFQRYVNWPLRGLFWLSKDLYEDKPGFKRSVEPDAQELSDIRNHIEHKYLKLHDDFWGGPPSKDDEVSLGLTDTLSYSMYRREFEKKTLRLLKMSRTALIYLSLSIHSEEKHRAKKRPPDIIVPGMFLDTLDDEWKR